MIVPQQTYCIVLHLLLQVVIISTTMSAKLYENIDKSIIFMLCLY